MTSINYLTMGGYASTHSEAGFTGQVLDASNDGCGWVYQVLEAGTITHLGFRIGDRSGTPPTYIIGIEGVGADGLPDGTYVGGGTPASATFTPPADSTWNATWRWIQLDNSYTVTVGQTICVTIRYSSGTVSGANCQTVFFSTALSAQNRGFPSCLTLTAGTWARNNASATYGYRTATRRYGNVAVGAGAEATATSGRRVASHFTMPVGATGFYKVRGFRIAANTPAAAATFKAGLWDASGNVIHEITCDSDNFTVSNSNDCQFIFTDASLSALRPGVKYYFGLESISNSSINVRGVSLTEAADREAYPNGLNRGASTWNGSVWTDNNLILPQLMLIIEDSTASVRRLNPNMGGGMW